MSSSKSHSRRPWWSTLGIYAGLSLAAFIMVIPLLFSFVTAFKSPQDFASHSPFALPSPPSLASFQAILTGRVNFGDAIITTLLVVVVMVVGQLVSSVLAAYAFARIEFPGREVIFWLFLGTMMIPASVLVIPLYLMMAKMGLNNTFWGIVLPFVPASLDALPPCEQAAISIDAAPIRAVAVTKRLFMKTSSCDGLCCYLMPVRAIDSTMCR